MTRSAQPSWSVKTDNGQHPVDRRASTDLGPGEGLHQRLGQCQTRGLDQDMLGWRGAVEQPFEGRQEILGHGTTDTAVGELDDVLLAATGLAAAEQ